MAEEDEESHCCVWYAVVAMKKTYLALLRGVNVGGKSLLPMAALREALTKEGFESVRTYIASGNVFVESGEPAEAVGRRIEKVITEGFGLEVPVVVFNYEEWKKIINEAPSTWGKDDAWKHNLLVLLPPYDMEEVIQVVGELKPGIEVLVPGEGVLYQSISKELFGVTTTGKLAASPIYKRMTVRNYGTSTKLLGLFEVG